MHLRTLVARRHPPVRACSKDLEELTVTQLKERLRAAGLKLSGRKAELVQRLRGSSVATSASAGEAPQPVGKLLVDGMNVGSVLDIPRRTLFAMLHLVCLTQKLHTTIIFDGPSFERVEYQSGGLEKGSAVWKALAARGAEAHGERLPAVEFVGHFAKDAADDVLHDRAQSLCCCGEMVLLWTFDRGLQRRVHESTAGRVRFLSREPLALLENARSEWLDVARHPLGGGGIEDLLRGKGGAGLLTRAAKTMLGVVSSEWPILLDDAHAGEWISNSIGYGFTQVGVERRREEFGEAPLDRPPVHILQDEYGLLEAVRGRWERLTLSPHGRAILRKAHPAFGPETCCAIAAQHAEHVYELSHHEEGAVLVRTLLRQVRLHVQEEAHDVVRSIVGGRWAAMATHEHAHAVVCALAPLVPLEILRACAQEDGWDGGGAGGIV